MTMNEIAPPVPSLALPAEVRPDSPRPSASSRAARAAWEVGLGVAVVFSIPHATRFLQSRYELPLTLAAVTVLALALAAILVDRRSLGRFGLRWPADRRRAHAITLLCVPAAALLGYVATQLPHRYETGYWLTPHRLLQLDLIIYFLGLHVLLAALPEELLFRGYLQTRLRAAVGGGLRDRKRTALAIALGGAIFFACHLPYADPRALLGVAAVGLFLGWVRERTGSLAGPVAAHAVFNATLAWVQVSHA